MLAGAIWNGLIMGLGLSFSFGPVFFMLLNTSIKRGWKESLIFDAGVLLSDFIIILLAILAIFILGININLENENIQLWTVLIGSSILITFGFMLVLKPHKNTDPSEMHLEGVAKLGAKKLFLKGLGINFINPSVFLIWFGSVPTIAAGYRGDMKLVAVFFSSTLIFYFLVDLLKIYSARKLKRFLTPLAITLFHRISGITFICIASWLIFNYFFN